MNGVGGNSNMKDQQRRMIDDSLLSSDAAFFDDEDVGRQREIKQLNKKITRAVSSSMGLDSEDDVNVLDSDADDKSGVGSTAENSNSSGVAGGGGGGGNTSTNSSNAVAALVQQENKWLFKARLFMLVLILIVTSLTALGVNLFMKYIEFEEFTTRVSVRDIEDVRNLKSRLSLSL